MIGRGQRNRNNTIASMAREEWGDDNKKSQIRGLTNLASEEGDENFFKIIHRSKLLFPVLEPFFHTLIIPEAGY